MAMKPKKEVSPEISVLEISQGRFDVMIIGNRPLIFNRMSEKAKRELLMPKGRKTAADRAQNLKHIPIQEYRDSVYRNGGTSHPTRLCFPASAFKGAMMTAALDLPGTKRTEIGRLVWVENDYVDIFGIPQLLMSGVRSADINKTPDIRTRAILPNWACRLVVSYTRPKLNGKAVSNLLAAGGITSGVGDFRQEKGKGSYGQYRLTDAKDAKFLDLEANARLVAQDEALANPSFYDAESEDLFRWFEKELARRGTDHGDPEPTEPEPTDEDLKEAA